MTIEQLIQDKLSRLETIPEQFISAVDKANIQIYKDVIKSLNSLEKAGDKIVFNAQNLAIAQQITDELKNSVFDTDYLTAVTEFANEFDVQANINSDYMAKQFGPLGNDTLFNSVLEGSKLSAVELLDSNAVEQQFTNPLKDLLISSITSGASFNSLIDSVNTFVLGENNNGGALTINAKNVAYDSYAFSDRQYTKAIAQQLDNEWFRYSGGILKDSRFFCEKYHNQYFHIREIEDFGNGIDIDGNDLTEQELQGRYPETTAANIFTFCGGYNCHHSYIPVSIASVPDFVIQRNIDKGYYKKAA